MYNRVLDVPVNYVATPAFYPVAQQQFIQPVVQRQFVQPQLVQPMVQVPKPMIQIPGSQESITTSYIFDRYNIQMAAVRQPLVMNKLEETREKIAADELFLIENTTAACPLAKREMLSERLGGLNAHNLQEFTTKQFQNPAVMEATLCATDSILYTSPYSVDDIYMNNRVRMYLHNLRQIGGESAEGYALIADLESAENMMVVKVSRDPQNDNLLHEAIVGLYGTNKLRRYIPNFAYVYGAFKCSPPLIDPETKKVATWCLHNENAVNYVLYENIAPSITARKYLQSCSGQEFVNMYLQVLYAERLALKLIDYTHFDLHTENVLLRKIDYDGEFQIAYETENGKEYITTRNVPTLIDYGFSHIKIPAVIEDGKVVKEEMHSGVSGFTPYFIYPDHSWIMHDMYKFLLFCLNDAIRANNTSVIFEASKIFRFFNKVEDPSKVADIQFDPLRYAFPLTEITNRFTIDNLARHIRRVCTTDFLGQKDPSLPALDCERLCVTEDTIYSNSGLDLKTYPKAPKDILLYYDIVRRLHNEGKIAERDAVINAFDYPTAIRNHVVKMYNLAVDLNNYLADYRLVDLSRMPAPSLLSANTLALVRKSYVTGAEIIDRTIELRFYYAIGTTVANYYEDTKSLDEMNQIMSWFMANVRPGLNEGQKVLIENDKYLNSIENLPEVRAAVAANNQLAWYWSGRKNFDLVFGRRTIFDTTYG